MSTLHDSSDRPPSDYFFFALGFLGVMGAAYGLAATSIPTAVVGVTLLGISVGAFFLKMLLNAD
jgi:hypothetical protein